MSDTWSMPWALRRRSQRGAMRSHCSMRGRISVSLRTSLVPIVKGSSVKTSDNAKCPWLAVSGSGAMAAWNSCPDEKRTDTDEARTDDDMMMDLKNMITRSADDL